MKTILIILRNLDEGGISTLYKNLFLESKKQDEKIHFIIVCFFANPSVLAEFESIGFPPIYLEYKRKSDYWNFRKQIKEIIIVNEVDVVHSNTPFDRFFIFLHNFSIPHITTFHTSTPFEKNSNFLHNFLFSFIDRVLLRIHKTKIIAVSYYVKEKLIQKKIDENQIRVVYTGLKRTSASISKSIEFEGKGKNFINLLCIGRFHSDKGQLFVIPLFNQLRQLNSRYQLYFLGERKGDYFKSVEALVDQYNLSESVHFLGYRSNVDDYLKKADGLLFPSQNEAFGLTLLEGLKNEALIFASNRGGIHEIIEDKVTGIFIDFSKPQSGASLINEVIHNKILSHNLKKDGSRKFHRAFSSKSFFLNYINIYNEVVQKE